MICILCDVYENPVLSRHFVVIFCFPIYESIVCNIVNERRCKYGIDFGYSK